MKILINSLQVNEDASKGHLHPALEVGLELKRRGHHVAIMPLPSPFNKQDRQQIESCQLEIIEPPPLPTGLPLSRHELAYLAKNETTVAHAYHSFLIAPLEYQFEQVIEKIKAFDPDIVVYDLLVYSAPLAARLLNIADIGYCAGLKLIAPSSLTKVYQSIYKQLTPSINHFLDKNKLSAEFHHLELLSTTHQLVFTPDEFIDEKLKIPPRNTILVGSLPISSQRCTQEPLELFKNRKNHIVLCFGSVLDPANYLDMTQLIIKLAAEFDHHLIINTQKAHLMPNSENITTATYLPLPQLLKDAALFIHHGGANTFSESLTMGVPQILIPLTTDQPIQAEFLRQSKVGISLHPDEVTEETLYQAFKKLLDNKNCIHQRIKKAKHIFQKSTGASVACRLIEKNCTIKVTSC